MSRGLPNDMRIMFSSCFDKGEPIHFFSETFLSGADPGPTGVPGNLCAGQCFFDGGEWHTPPEVKNIVPRWMELFIRASSFRKRDCEPSSGVYVVANISVGSIDDIFDWYGLK
jgi:hypothetical protein